MNEFEITNYKNYFKCLESDLFETARYAEPMGQEDVYSFEYFKIIMLACSEVETVLKLICKSIDARKSPRNIKEYAEIFLDKYPKIKEVEVSVSRICKTIKPFKDWSTEKCMKWWDEHQDIKHHRHKDFEKATYRNAMYSLAGLYVLLLYLIRINDVQLDIDSNYFYNDSEGQPHYVSGPGRLLDFE